MPSTAITLGAPDASLPTSIHASKCTLGPYTLLAMPRKLPYTPSLVWFCLHKLAQFPDQVAAIGNIRLTYRPPKSSQDEDILRSLIPLDPSEFDWALVDPRLWCTIVQIYDNLPASFTCYSIPLADEHLPALQLPSTPNFSLVTILELPGCRELTDATIVELKRLHSLCALDVSGAPNISSHAIRVLAGTVLWSEAEQRGPWCLRVLRCRNCKAIDNKILPHLSSFPLLSLLDLRGTRCSSKAFLPTFKPSPGNRRALFHPTPLHTVIDSLRETPSVFSSPNIFILKVNTLYYAPLPTIPLPSRKSTIDDVCVTLHPDTGQYSVHSTAQLSNDPDGGRETDHNPYSCDCARCRRRLSLFDHRHKPTDRLLQQQIATEELSTEATVRRIASFYGVGRRSSTTLTKSYTSHVHEYTLNSNWKEDISLMLYRDPPPWSDLASMRPPTRPRQPVEIVKVAASKRKMAEMADFANELVARKRQKKESDATTQAKTSMFASGLPANPFRRKPKEELAQQSPIGKPLKPITSITAPTLPPGSEPKPRPVAQSKKKAALFDWTKWGKK
ncbi:hypothetical protein MIND_01032300 [Mycena indigotica]|uniref:Uncharacterized protein n=1 Tax=Mycena indigotica TaxID=2126181 RepID=A0A8H6SAV5_9AGAR|nr:uncharacterized protein MIND_01032300 [Mycena indigotica]KAF7294942.1 hypothetical protein MIND_01032300 [Mycena indigotica]